MSRLAAEILSLAFNVMMMAPDYYVFTGGVVPDHVTHVLIDKALKFVPANAFYEHPNIQEVICHDGVLKVEHHGFFLCRSLRRVIMPGVKILELNAFNNCGTLTYVECGKLERIGKNAFVGCRMSSIDLLSVKIVDGYAFSGCRNLVNPKFGKVLELIGEGAFHGCRSLECITLPLKDDVITADTTFMACEKLHRVDLIGLHETVAALLMEEWKNDMNEEIGTIYQNLASAPAGDLFYHAGGKAREIRTWIRSVLPKLIHYKTEHQRILSEAAATLQAALPNDIVLKSIFQFIELPAYTFEGEN